MTDEFLYLYIGTPIFIGALGFLVTALMLRHSRRNAPDDSQND